VRNASLIFLPVSGVGLYPDAWRVAIPFFFAKHWVAGSSPCFAEMFFGCFAHWLSGPAFQRGRYFFPDLLHRFAKTISSLGHVAKANAHVTKAPDQKHFMIESLF
jgi:hypothetical protein